MKKLFLGASMAGLVLSVSCSHDRMVEAPKAEEQAAVSYTVPVEEALAALQSDLDAMQTRGAARTVADVQTLFGSGVAGTRSAGEDAPLAYVVNFEEGGYAILGADLRQDPVVAIVNENSMTPETLAAAKRAVDAGEEVDTPTYVNALVADYLVRSLAENQPRIDVGTWEIKEHKTSMILTKWGQNGVYGSNLNPATVAICQLVVYNKKFNRVGFDRLGVYAPNWTLLNTAATAKTPVGNCAGEVARLCSVMDETILINQNGRTIIETIVHIMRSTMRNYYVVQAFSIGGVNDMNWVVDSIRNMLYENNMPVYFEGSTSTGSRHAWVLDGWQMKEYSSDGGREYLVYCNFGQDGVNDGLYSFGAFRGYNNDKQFITYNFGD